MHEAPLINMTGEIAVGDHEPEEYDLFIGALGYEPRSTFAYKNLLNPPSKTLIIAFPDRHVGGYDQARLELQHLEVEPVELQDSEVGKYLRTRFEESFGESSEISIALDISSMTRTRMATILEEIFELARRYRVDLDIYYAPSRYVPPVEHAGPLTFLGPVSNSFAALQSDPELPTIAIVGVGYEDERGLGVIEYLEASDAWILVPVGFDDDFDRAMNGANRHLLSRMSERRLNYNPTDPVRVFQSVQSLAHSLREDYRVVMVPMGPKILAMCCLMVALGSDGRDAVWRASVGESGEPKFAEASGTLTGLHFKMTRQTDEFEASS